jgi:hypothetical protein
VLGGERDDDGRVIRALTLSVPALVDQMKGTLRRWLYTAITRAEKGLVILA